MGGVDVRTMESTEEVVVYLSCDLGEAIVLGTDGHEDVFDTAYRMLEVYREATGGARQRLVIDVGKAEVRPVKAFVGVEGLR